MTATLNRRSFVKLSALAASGIVFKPLPPIESNGPVGLGRVTVASIGLYSEPTFKATRRAYIKRDTLLTLLERVRADDGPVHNPIWFQISDGYVHSGQIQCVSWKPAQPREDLPENGALFEVCVPFTRTYRKPDPQSDPLYRLYYQSTAWVISVEKGSDGRTWYCLLDDLLKYRYYARAEHLRFVKAEELEPISTHLEPHEKRLEVSLAYQELRAYEKDELIFRTSISSGIPSQDPGPNGIPTATPRGRFYITKKTPLRHMGDGHLTPSLEAYELPGVPWVSFFHHTGVAFHGTYWHTDFGRPKSHGCINMRSEEAKWLFRWSTPVIEADEMLKAGHGTTVDVF